MNRAFVPLFFLRQVVTSPCFDAVLCYLRRLPCNFTILFAAFSCGCCGQQKSGSTLVRQQSFRCLTRDFPRERGTDPDSSQRFRCKEFRRSSLNFRECVREFTRLRVEKTYFSGCKPRKMERLRILFSVQLWPETRTTHFADIKLLRRFWNSA